MSGVILILTKMKINCYYDNYTGNKHCMQKSKYMINERRGNTAIQVGEQKTDYKTWEALQEHYTTQSFLQRDNRSFGAVAFAWTLLIKLN